MMKKITIIIPVYNTGKLLHKTINSILKQQFPDIEILLIDDGSNDGLTPQICDKLSVAHRNIKVFHRMNQGIENTKVFGIQKAEGKYIMFCDHDDLYLSNSISRLYRKIESTQADIVSGNYYEQIFRNLPVRYKGFTIAEEKNMNHEEFMKQYYINFFGINIFNVSTWAKIYRTNMLKNIRFTTLGYNTTEDVVLNMQIFPEAKRVVFIKDFLYVHIRGGLTSKPNPQIMLNNYNALYDLKERYINKYNIGEAIPPVNYEMKNILKHFVLTSMQAGSSKDEITSHLELFKNKASYLNFYRFFTEKDTADDFMNNYIKGDYEQLYLMLNRELLAGGITRSFVRFAKKFL